jgi:hypothetical protein
MCGCSSALAVWYWSASTPIAQSVAGRVATALNNPSPEAPAAWKMTSAPPSYSLFASASPFVWSLNASVVDPMYSVRNLMFGLISLAPASQPAWNFSIRPVPDCPPRNPSVSVYVFIAAAAPTR